MKFLGIEAYEKINHVLINVLIMKIMIEELKFLFHNLLANNRIVS